MRRGGRMSETGSDNEAIAVYNEHIQVISELKKSQWQIITSLILLYGGIIALHKEIQPALPLEIRCVSAFLVPFIIWGLGAWVQIRLHRAVAKRRNRIAVGRTELSRKANAVYGLPPASNENCCKDIDVPAIGIVSTLIAALICWSLLSGTPITPII